MITFNVHDCYGSFLGTVEAMHIGGAMLEARAKFSHAAPGLRVTEAK